MSAEESWVKVAEMADIASRPLKAVYPRGVPVLIVSYGNDVFALSNRCPHLGCPLSAGTLKDGTVTCPCHDWTFEARTGELTISREIKLAKYETKVEDGSLYVRLED